MSFSRPRHTALRNLLLPFALGGTMLALPMAAQTPAASSSQVIAYVFPQGKPLVASSIAANELTRINYAFANISNGQIVEGNPADTANFATLLNLKQRNPSLKILVSVGGWLWSGHFSDVVLTPESRSRFTDSVVAFLQQHQLDGLDIDWEYPGMRGAGNTFRPADGANFTLLLQQLRRRFDAQEATTHRHWFLSIAAGTSAEYISHVELGKDAALLDTVNLMAYDFYEPGDGGLTGNHAALYTDPADPKALSADHFVQAFEAAGVPPGKIVLGVPFYGHVWANVSPAHNGLFQHGSSAHTTDAGFAAIQTTMLGQGFERFWDAASSVPFLYNPARREFVSYEDPQSLALKCRYVLSHGLGGIMFWEYTNDPSGTLLNTIHTTLHPRT